MQIDKTRVKKILLIKPRGIGDVVLSSIVFDNLKEEFPEAKIDYLTEKPSNFLLEPLEFINEVIIMKKKTLGDRIKLFSTIRKNKYDLVFDFYATPLTTQVTFLSGARYRVGFPYKGRKFAYNLFGPAERDKFHAAELHLEMIKSVGISGNHKNLEIGYNPDDVKFAEELKREIKPEGKLLIGVSPSGGWASKKCPAEIFSKLVNETQKKFNCKILILWGPGDKDDAEYIYNNRINDEVIFAPPTSIGQMATCTSVCDMFIANDSGPMHISTATDTPTLSIHGPTDPKLQGPYGDKHSYILVNDLDCIICNLLDCPKNQECFRNIEVDQFINEVGNVLTKNNLI
ncbi:MAG: glycosyltransferase family 9 protein [Rhodothermaceae bacterium]